VGGTDASPPTEYGDDSLQESSASGAAGWPGPDSENPFDENSFVGGGLSPAVDPAYYENTNSSSEASFQYDWRWEQMEQERRDAEQRERDFLAGLTELQSAVE